MKNFNYLYKKYSLSEGNYEKMLSKHIPHNKRNEFLTSTGIEKNI